MGLGLGISVDWASLVPYYAKVASAFAARVKADGGTVENTACLKKDLKVLSPTPPPAFTGLLNTYSGAAAAYSLRLLNNAYSGNAIKVRRSSDNAERDIAFTNNELDTASLETFASGTDAFVTTWYDQSGSGNDATQTTASVQPKIVQSGSVLLLNSKPAIDPSGDAQLNLSALSLNGNFNITNVSDFNDTGMPYGGAGGHFVYFTTTTQVRYRLSGVTFNYTVPTMVDGDQLLMNINRSGNNMNYRHLGSEISTLIDANPIEVFVIDRLFTGNGSLNGPIANQEIIIWNSDQSSNRTDIETNINDFYSIY